MSILEKILAQKQVEIARDADRVSLSELKRQSEQLPPCLSFSSALEKHPHPAIIAELKKASPSKGLIRADFEPIRIANEYCQSLAACLSVLTDETFFQGSNEYLIQVRTSLPSIPILRKDFICHEYQVWQARAIGADALLLIVAALSAEQLASLAAEAKTAGLEVLVEVHNEAELDQAITVLGKAFICADKQYPRCILGINNRNLKDFSLSLETTEKLLCHLKARYPDLADSLVVAESGIHNASDIKLLSSFGAGAFLVGESLLASGNPGENLKALIRGSRPS